MSRKVTTTTPREARYWARNLRTLHVGTTAKPGGESGERTITIGRRNPVGEELGYPGTGYTITESHTLPGPVGHLGKITLRYPDGKTLTVTTPIVGKPFEAARSAVELLALGLEVKADRVEAEEVAARDAAREAARIQDVEEARTLAEAEQAKQVAEAADQDALKYLTVNLPEEFVTFIRGRRPVPVDPTATMISAAVNTCAINYIDLTLPAQQPVLSWLIEQANEAIPRGWDLGRAGRIARAALRDAEAVTWPNAVVPPLGPVWAPRRPFTFDHVEAVRDESRGAKSDGSVAYIVSRWTIHPAGIQLVKAITVWSEPSPEIDRNGEMHDPSILSTSDLIEAAAIALWELDEGDYTPGPLYPSPSGDQWHRYNEFGGVVESIPADKLAEAVAKTSRLDAQGIRWSDGDSGWRYTYEPDYNRATEAVLAESFQFTHTSRYYTRPKSAEAVRAWDAVHPLVR